MQYEFKAFIIRMIIFVVLVGGLIGGSLSALINIRGQYLYRDGDWHDRYIPSYNQSAYNILFDSHSHTLQSGGALTPEQNIQYHIAMGYNSCVITDKLSDDISCWDSTRAALRIARENYSSQILVLIGIEWGSDRGHYNIILPPNTTALDDYMTQIPYYGSNPSDLQIQQFINAVHAIGGVVIVDHLLYSLPIMPTHPSRENLTKWGIDYYEVVNDADFDYDSYLECKTSGVGMIGTTGMHIPDETFVHGWTLLNSLNWSEQAIFDEIKYRKTELLYQSFAVPYNATHLVNPAYVIFRPLRQLGEMIYEYFPGKYAVDWTGFSIFLFYFGISFIFSELSRNIFRKKINRPLRTN